MMWLPAVEYVATGTPRGHPLGISALRLDDLEWRDLLSCLSPSLAFGGGAGTWWGIRTAWARLHYQGIATLALAVTGVIMCRRRREVGAPVVLAGLGVLLATGHNLPCAGPLVKGMAPFTFFRHSALWLALTDLGIAWLAAVGLREWLARPPAERSRVVRAFVAAAACMAAVSVAGYALRPLLLDLGKWVQAGWATSVQDLMRPAILLALTGALFCIRPVHPRWVGVGVIALTSADLISTGTKWQPTAPSAWVVTPTGAEEKLSAMEKELAGGWGRTLYWPVARIPGVREDGLVMGRDRRALVRNLRAGLQPNLPAVSGWRMADGVNPLVPTRTAAALRLPRTTNIDASLKSRIAEMGVRVVISGEDLSGLGTPVRSGETRLYRVRGATGLVHIEPRGSGQLMSSREVGPGWWRASCVASGPTAFEISETFVRGWRATVSGSRTRVRPANGGFLNVCVPPGRHEVEARFDPVSFRLGLLASMTFLTALVGVAMRPVR